ncbi:hemolysin family protein [Campylobacter troglodytis]|uniref:hemolysin family protein n=1 Tax=Campylobacter troglodytis TaxID=654363 RepID=UPI003CFCD1F2
MDPSQIPPAINAGYSTLMIFVAFIFVFLNGFFVLSEFSIVKVRRSKLEQLVKEKKPNAKQALRISSELDTYLSACQLGITLSSLALGWIGEPAIAKLLSFWLSGFNLSSTLLHTLSFIIAFSLITLLHVVIGELVPKSVAIAMADKTALWVARPLHIFWILFLPLIKSFDFLARISLKLIGVKPAKEHDELVLSEEEIKIIASESQKGGVLDEFETEIIRNAVDFSDIVAKEVMTPRKDMICLNKNKSYKENMKIVSESKHTRFPYIDESKDNILGIIHIRDLMQNEITQGKKDLEDFVRPIFLVPENVSISQVLIRMNKERTHTALVMDEYGGTAGLITMEDIMEEIVGDINDEHDDKGENYKKLAENVYEFKGRCDIETVEDLLLISFDDNLEQNTIGGYVFNLLGRLPVVGDKIEDELCLYEVKKMDQNSIDTIKIIKKTE